MKLTTYLSLAAIMLLLPFCKKAETPTPETTAKTPPSLLCDGNGTSDYFPIKLNNKWVYLNKKNGVVNDNKAPVSFNPGFTLKNKPYLTLEDSSIGNEEIYSIPYYMAKDSAGNTVSYEGFTQKDYIVVPAKPKLNETWTIESSAVRKSSNLNASLKTDYCNYTGLLQINEYPGGAGTTGMPKSKYYYKKGLGLVYKVTYEVQTQGDSVEWILTKVTLK